MLGSGDGMKFIGVFARSQSAFRTTPVRPFELENIKGMEVRDKPLHIWRSTCLFDGSRTVDCTPHRVCVVDYQLANNMALFVAYIFYSRSDGGNFGFTLLICQILYVLR